MQNLTHKLARSILTSNGIAAVRQLQAAADEARRMGIREPRRRSERSRKPPRDCHDRFGCTEESYAYTKACGSPGNGGGCHNQVKVDDRHGAGHRGKGSGAVGAVWRSSRWLAE